jgi:hypothetical protein
MATATATRPGTDVLRKGTKVVAAVAMPGIPEGTAGKVTMVSGFTWIRYWVRFENGVVRGSINRNKLAPLDDWEAILDRRARGEEEPEAVEADAASTGAAGGDSGPADGEGGGGEGVTHNGVLIPAHLLERSKTRRAALGK